MNTNQLIVDVIESVRHRFDDENQHITWSERDRLRRDHINGGYRAYKTFFEGNRCLFVEKKDTSKPIHDWYLYVSLSTPWGKIKLAGHYYSDLYIVDDSKFINTPENRIMLYKLSRP